MALKPTLKSKLIRALKSKIVVKPKLARITKYKNKIIKLYTFYTYSIKALIIRGGQGTKFKSKLSKAIISILDKESSSFNNTNIKDNNKDKLIKI